MKEQEYSIGLLEISLIQVILYASLWLTNEYLATLLTIILTIIFAAILLISLFSEFIEKSKVPTFYYQLMVISILVPIITASFFYFIYGGQFDWLPQ